ncbi:hypothetical protein HBH56_024100 [Parastagonospora nodorum]|uniref:Uncharacterized protein n=2 Tax=Phaeosphaeria nodorum (strain SN15 / ATCC MYA-4574 / FGSC 10173) TaxID=321614 RepID=A0A7U2F4W9_PHANO|nr:hypothetical protein HBH56_024100 [Parastagonospora nodorum]QRC98768.1 hypothetical protein JI435_436310 [Parastagonospora nodorum SN15]KAH3934445.1 hypothetical protein HBH54_057920 [Parastagonospora nodorum]KAH3976084.1 hypothetical protein HBH51_079760 [Parastagonospora nodorum]KAH3985330.1 hypothetical protein HBH52_056730 [Parastagonospora nodorum]
MKTVKKVYNPRNPSFLFHFISKNTFTYPYPKTHYRRTHNPFIPTPTPTITKMKPTVLLTTLFATLAAAAPVPPIDMVSNVCPQGETNTIVPPDGLSNAYPERDMPSSKQDRDLGGMCKKFCGVNPWMCKFCEPVKPAEA